MEFDFGKALNQGIGAANVTAVLNAEIEQIITEVSRQVYQATDQQITIKIESRSNGMAAVAQMFSVKGSSILKQVHFVVASNMTLQRSEDLAVWERSPTAYPCKLIYSDQTAYCNDKASLEKQFVHLLSHPETGKKMLKLLAPPMQISGETDGAE
ncbi:hypothetical protein AB1462_16225 [Pseudomonas sp. SB113]|uniref:hypothetical protein n=1 Tax=Pseudomonas sp. SB113 TaxID=3154123 RepID=UPI00345D2159